MENTKGYIYILTNPAFSQFVKIGYAKDVKERLRTLNASSAIPYGFRLYATYAVESELSDKELHAIIDTLNPDLRTKDKNGNKVRIREFFEMSPERAYSILEAMAKIHNTVNCLQKYNESTSEKRETKEIKNTLSQQIEKGEVFSFEKCHIPVGAELHYINDDTIICKVVDSRKVEYNGKIMYLSGLAKKLLNVTYGVAGPLYFTYLGKNLQEYYEQYQR